jgi:NADPH-dependent curcumin reductase CurA
MLQDGTPPPGLSESSAISTLGFTALTAYVGLTQIGKVKSTDTVVISGAAGATGSAAVQIAKKIFGCKRVIGIAGGQKKVRLLRFLLVLLFS